MSVQTKKFKTEVQHLLDLMIHSLYSNKDIFLRELIANAADAIDKARFEALTKKDVAQDWKISLAVDKDKKTVTITDNGIGMTEKEVVENIGTIAKSGTKAFMTAMEEQGGKADIPELIGQFGVGFYSSFMVADKVVLTTKKAGEDKAAVRWSSTGKESYSLTEAEKAEQGTEVVVYLKEEAAQYLENWKISEIVRTYSDFIEYPITLPFVTTNEDKTETVEVKTLNSQKAIWLKKSSEITEEEHKSFFSHVSHHGGNPLKSIQVSAEGTTEFKALLYIPEQAPFNFFMPDAQKNGLQLYVKRVFITDNCEQLIPDYMRFLSGVVDSSDLPLNVSREILQDNPLLGKIKKNLTLKVLSELKKMKEKERESYEKFFKEFGKVLKEGIHLDYTNQEKLKDLALYETMNHKAGELITLKEYVDGMPSEQSEIYYITGESRQVLENSAALELFRSKGYDVLFMVDPIDEWVVQSMQQYAKKNFKVADKGDIALDDSEESKEKLESAKKQHEGLLEALKKAMPTDISEVRFTNRLTDSACCLVAAEGAISPQMERMFRAMNQEVPETKRILELNPEHALVAALEEVYESADRQAELADYAGILYDQALLTEGSAIKNPLEFSKKVSELMVKALKK